MDNFVVLLVVVLIAYVVTIICFTCLYYAIKVNRYNVDKKVDLYKEVAFRKDVHLREESRDFMLRDINM